MSKKNTSETPESCKIFSKEFFALCGAGGALACGSTHLIITPLDVIKCRLQVDQAKYKNLINGFKVSIKESGISVLAKGWTPTLIGYSIQGAIKFGGYEYFKYKFADMVTPHTAYYQRTYLYLLAAASAEFVADFFLAPFEATKVRMQTTPGYTSKMRLAMPQMLKDDGIGVFFRGLPPLWGRQVPYTVVKFVSFEWALEYLYQNVVPKTREKCSKPEQLLVTFAAGYIAGVLCAIASHPADTLVSKLNKDPKASIGEIVKELGFRGIWRGLPTRIIMIGTIAALQWLIFDGFKVYARMPRPPPPVPPY